ncbi:MAG: pyruvate dehydrogenase (acetyl-transferring) E1 component subunit alpha [Dehalococcoidia bacterium]
MVRSIDQAAPSREQLITFYRQMQLIRRFEEAAAVAYQRRKIGGFLHLYIGEEAVAVGAIGSLQPQDYIVSSYREHGHAIARGLDINALMAELFGKVTGVSRGKGGSMHLFDETKGFLGGYAIVAGQMPIATGLGLSASMRGEDRVCMCFFGDGAVNEGEFHEALNLASLWKTPVVFICENNLYGMGTALARHSAMQEIYRRAEAYNMPSERADGMDVLATYATVQKAVEHARGGNGPYFIEAMTYRFRAHSMADPELYRTKDEVNVWRQRDPIPRLRAHMVEQGVATEEDLNALDAVIERTVDEAVRFADESPEPPISELWEHVYVGNYR